MSVHLHVEATPPSAPSASATTSLARSLHRVLELVDAKAIVIADGGVGDVRATTRFRAEREDAELLLIARRAAAVEAASQSAGASSQREFVSDETDQLLSVTSVQLPGHAPVLVVVDRGSVRTRAGSPTRRSLTPRQQAVVEAVVHGASVREAADALGIAVHTARRHLEAAHARLDVRRRSQLVRQWVEREA